MDVETSEAIDRLGERIDALAATLSGDIRAVRDELRGEMGVLSGALRGEMGVLREDLRAELRGGLAENRRHTEVLFESVRDDIRIVAEGLAVLATKVERLLP